MALKNFNYVSHFWAVIILSLGYIRAGSLQCEHSWNPIQCRQHFKQEYAKYLMESNFRSLERLLRDYIEIYDRILEQLPEDEIFYVSEIRKFLHECLRMLHSLEHIRHDPHQIMSTVHEVRRHLKVLTENRRFEKINEEMFQEILDNLKYERLGNNARMAAKEEMQFLIAKWMSFYDNLRDEDRTEFDSYNRINEYFTHALSYDDSKESEQAFLSGYQMMKELFEQPDWTNSYDLVNME